MEKSSKYKIPIFHMKKTRLHRMGKIIGITIDDTIDNNFRVLNGELPNRSRKPEGKFQTSAVSSPSSVPEEPIRWLRLYMMRFDEMNVTGKQGRTRVGDGPEQRVRAKNHRHDDPTKYGSPGGSGGGGQHGTQRVEQFRGDLKK